VGSGFDGSVTEESAANERLCRERVRTRKRIALFAMVAPPCFRHLDLKKSDHSKQEKEQRGVSLRLIIYMDELFVMEGRV